MESRIQGWMKNIKYVELSFKSIDFCDLITNIGYSDFVRIINVLMAKTYINIRNTFLQAIPRGELHPCIEGKRQENLSKNKYTTIFPCR